MFSSHSSLVHRINLAPSPRRSFASLKLMFVAVAVLAALYALLAAGTVWAKGSDEATKELETKETIPDYSKYRIADDKNLEKIKDDDYERIKARIKAELEAERSNPPVRQIEDEIRELEKAEEKRKAEEVKASAKRQREESQQQADQLEEFEEELEDVREEIEDEGEDLFPEITRDEIEWNGLYD